MEAPDYDDVFQKYFGSEVGWIIRIERPPILKHFLLYEILVLIRIFLTIYLRKIFKKAWRKWREALIPVWNIFVLFKISWRKYRFIGAWPVFIALICSIISRLLFSVKSREQYGCRCIIHVSDFQWTMMASFLVFLALSLIFKGIMAFALAKRFWKSKKFGLWLLLLSPIYFWILAFWKAKYTKFK